MAGSRYGHGGDSFDSLARNGAGAASAHAAVGERRSPNASRFFGAIREDAVECEGGANRRMVFIGAGAQAAVSAEFHGQPHSHLIGWLVAYEAATAGVISADNSTTFLDIDNDPQPDASLRILPTHGGRTKLNDEGYIEGAPELLAEIAA